MFQRPLYQTSIALLTVAFLTGAAYYLAAPAAPPGIAITLPPTAESTAAVDTTPFGATAADAGGRVNINTASAAELAAALPGVGAVLSQRIVDYREANGPFARTDLLTGVSGIGPGIYERLRDLVTVGD